MANRAYLYSSTNDFSKIRDLSESRHPIPLAYRILLGIETELAESRIWNNPDLIALKSNFEKGLQQFTDFLEYLKTQEEVNQEIVAEAIKNTKDFFAENPDRISDLFFLEGGEIFDLISDIDPIKEQNESLCQDIISMAKDIGNILEFRPKYIFNYSKAYWLTELKKEPEKLNIYWATVTYFSFNKT